MTIYNPNFMGDENIAIAKAGDLIIHVRYNRSSYEDLTGLNTREVWLVSVFDLAMHKLGQEAVCSAVNESANPLSIMRSAVSFLSACAESRLHGNEDSENYYLWDEKIAHAASCNSSELEMLALELDEFAISNPK